MREAAYQWPLMYIRLIVVFAILVFWEILGRLNSGVAFSVGTPSEAVRELIAMLIGGRLLFHAAVTGFEAATGLILGVTIGSVIGLSFWYSRVAAEAARPFLVMAGNAPVFALAPLLVIWFGVGLGMKVALAFFFTFFLTVAATQRGAEAVATEWVNVYRILGGSKHGAFRRIIVPGALDAVLASVRVGIALALLGAFVGEFIASDRGLGYVILRAARVFNAPQAMGGAIAFVIMAVLLDQAAAALERRRASLLQLIGVNAVLRR